VQAFQDQEPPPHTQGDIPQAEHTSTFFNKLWDKISADAEAEEAAAAHEDGAATAPILAALSRRASSSSLSDIKMDALQPVQPWQHVVAGLAVKESLLRHLNMTTAYSHLSDASAAQPSSDQLVPLLNGEWHHNRSTACSEAESRPELGKTELGSWAHHAGTSKGDVTQGMQRRKEAAEVEWCARRWRRVARDRNKGSTEVIKTLQAVGTIAAYALQCESSSRESRKAPASGVASTELHR
jgi:hypothetical protein